MTEKMSMALVCLMSEPTLEKAAAKANISSRTLRKYRRDAEFQNELAKIRAETIEDAVLKLQSALVPAVSFLVDIIRILYKSTMIQQM